MKLMYREPIGAGAHRSGWPRVMDAIRGVSSNSGSLLDDFADASFSYRSMKTPHVEPWVGIFHHPAAIDSPLQSDNKHRLREIAQHCHWESSRRHLLGAVCMCSESAEELGEWLGIPVTTIWHPTERDVPLWMETEALEERVLLQAGFFLRNIQLIFQIGPNGWRRVQLVAATRGYRTRNRALKNLSSRPRIAPDQVDVQPWIDNQSYDSLFAKCVVVTELYGAAANNLIVECMVRGTPLLTNRLPSVVEYLGSDYPLFFEDVNQIPELLEHSRLKAANAQLLERSQLLPSFEQFAQHVATFVSSLSLG